MEGGHCGLCWPTVRASDQQCRPLSRAGSLGTAVTLRSQPHQEHLGVCHGPPEPDMSAGTPSFIHRHGFARLLLTFHSVLPGPGRGFVVKSRLDEGASWPFWPTCGVGAWKRGGMRSAREQCAPWTSCGLGQGGLCGGSGLCPLESGGQLPREGEARYGSPGRAASGPGFSCPGGEGLPLGRREGRRPCRQAGQGGERGRGVWSLPAHVSTAVWGPAALWSSRASTDPCEKTPANPGVDSATTTHTQEPSLNGFLFSLQDQKVL